MATTSPSSSRRGAPARHNRSAARPPAAGDAQRRGVLCVHRQLVGAACKVAKHDQHRRWSPRPTVLTRSLAKRVACSLMSVRSIALDGLHLGRRSARSLRHCGQRLRKTPYVRLLAGEIAVLDADDQPTLDQFCRCPRGGSAVDAAFPRDGPVPTDNSSPICCPLT